MRFRNAAHVETRKGERMRRRDGVLATEGKKWLRRSYCSSLFLLLFSFSRFSTIGGPVVSFDGAAEAARRQSQVCLMRPCWEQERWELSKYRHELHRIYFLIYSTNTYIYPCTFLQCTKRNASSNPRGWFNTHVWSHILYKVCPRTR